MYLTYLFLSFFLLVIYADRITFSLDNFSHVSQSKNEFRFSASATRSKNAKHDYRLQPYATRCIFVDACFFVACCLRLRTSQAQAAQGTNIHALSFVAHFYSERGSLLRFKKLKKKINNRLYLTGTNFPSPSIYPAHILRDRQREKERIESNKLEQSKAPPGRSLNLSRIRTYLLTFCPLHHSVAGAYFKCKYQHCPFFSQDFITCLLQGSPTLS